MVTFAFWMGCHGSIADHRCVVGCQEAIMVGQMRSSDMQEVVRIRGGEKISLRSAQDVKSYDFAQLPMGNE